MSPTPRMFGTRVNAVTLKARVLELLGKYPMSVPALARRTGSNEDHMFMILRTLREEGHDIVKTKSDGLYGDTRATYHLKKP